MQTRDQLAKLARTLGGIPVWGSLPGSPSRALGVRYGDVVISVNGMRTSNIDEYLEARNLRTDAASVVIFREGRELVLHFEIAADAQGEAPDRLDRAAREVVEGRMLPSEPPPAAPSEDGN